MEESRYSKNKRKEEGKRLKRQRIDESGGVRPRKPTDESAGANVDVTKNTSVNFMKKNKANSMKSSHTRGRVPSSNHRFGRVMENVPCRNQPRHATVSLAIPGSVVANCQTRELKTQISGQIARAATIYHVDEIIVFDDKLVKQQTRNNYHRSRDREDRRPPELQRGKDSTEIPASGSTDGKKSETSNHDPADRPRSSADPHAFMSRILQYCECPQYLRRHFFPMHPDLQFAGLLAPVDAPHHVRAEDRCPFREGVVLDKATQGTTGSLVNCGIRGRPVHIEQRIQPGVRCTIQIDPAAYGRPGPLHGKVVSPSLVTQTDGTYWGYSVRMASSIKAVFDECPYAEQKYDLTIGTSERGSESIDDPSFKLTSSKPYRHALIVVGGVAGIEECVDADESLQLSGAKSNSMFDKWINICAFQGSRTIRSEEAVLISLAKLSPMLADNKVGKEKVVKALQETKIDVKFSDNDLSEESSESDDSSSDSDN